MSAPISEALNISNVVSVYHTFAYYFACSAVATVATYSLLFYRRFFEVIVFVAYNNHSAPPFILAPQFGQKLKLNAPAVYPQFEHLLKMESGIPLSIHSASADSC